MVRSTSSANMTIDVDWEVKHQMKPKNYEGPNCSQKVGQAKCIRIRYILGRSLGHI